MWINLWITVYNSGVDKSLHLRSYGVILDVCGYSAMSRIESNVLWVNTS